LKLLFSTYDKNPPSFYLLKRGQPRSSKLLQYAWDALLKRPSRDRMQAFFTLTLSLLR
jgi:hypothetical protein